jgi:hypothetical protein
MATGWPMKTTYADGDVYSASDVNDITGTINLLGQSVTTSAGKNTIIGGGFDIWQRGTSIAVNGATSSYTADRWLVESTAASVNTTTTRQATGDTTNLPFIQYCARIQRNSGVTANGFISLYYSMETVNTIPFAGRTVTLSYYARKGANYSSASNALGVQLRTGTGTDQKANAYTGSVNAVDTSVTLTSTWQRFTSTVAIPSTITEIGLNFYYLSTGTAGAADYYEITGVQLEYGATATTFSRAGGTIQGELAACQRYCFAVTSGATDRTTSQGNYYNSTTFVSTVAYPVTMRTTPSATIVTAANYWVIYANNTQDYADSASFGGAGLNAGNLEITGNASGTQGTGGQLRTNNAAASVILSAEL